MIRMALPVPGLRLPRPPTARSRHSGLTVVPGRWLRLAPPGEHDPVPVVLVALPATAGQVASRRAGGLQYRPWAWK